MPSVFISYARDDAAKARAISREIERAGFDVWMDQRISSGSEFSREIEAALAEASAVLVIWSEKSIESPWVRDEAGEGRDSGRLVPVMIDNCRPPMGFRQFQATDLSQWSGRGKPPELEQLLVAIQAKCEGPLEVRKPRPARPRHFKLRPFWAAVAAGLLLLGAAFLYLNRSGKDAEAAPSLAIAPITADASDAEARKLAAAVHDAVAHNLSQGAFSISVLETNPTAGPAPADYLLTGRVVTSGDRVTTTVRIEDTVRHIVIFSHQWEEPRDKAGEIPDRVGAQVASQISWAAPLIQMERRHPSEPAITAALLGDNSAGLDSINALSSYERSRRLAAKAPDSPLAQNGLAFNAAFALGQLPRSQRSEAVKLGREALDRVLKLAPEIGDNHIPWCILRSEQRKVQCEDRLRAAMRIDPDAPFVGFFLGSLLSEVGRNAEAAELIRVSHAHDPFMPHKIGLMLRMLELTGQTGEAADLYTQAARWWPGSVPILWRRFSGMVARGDFKAAQAFNKQVDDPFKVDTLLSAINRNSLDALRSACPSMRDFEGTACILSFARLGDLNAAYALAEEVYPSRRGRTPAEEERIWLDQPDINGFFFLSGPAAAPLRRDPRYLALAERVGLLEYWRSGRSPDFCAGKNPEPICRHIVKAR